MKIRRMTDMAQQPLIRLQNVAKRFGMVRAVDGIDLDINRGEAVTIFGPNGAGKTTLLRMIAGLSRPSGGAIYLGDEEITDGHHDQIRRRIGYISHQGLTYPNLTAAENLAFFCKLYGVTDPQTKTSELLEEVGLTIRADDLVGSFSRGMKQRLSIARALVHDPDIILLDEPFTGLDQHASGILRAALARLRTAGRTTIMITHNMTTGIEMSSRVLIQVAGRISYDQPVETIDRNTFYTLYDQTVSQGGA